MDCAYGGIRDDDGAALEQRAEPTPVMHPFRHLRRVHRPGSGTDGPDDEQPFHLNDDVTIDLYTRSDGAPIHDDAAVRGRGN